MLPAYRPVVLGSRQSQYGYWIVTVSTEPGKRAEVMYAKLGSTSIDAEAAVIEALPHLLPEQVRR